MSNGVLNAKTIIDQLKMIEASKFRAAADLETGDYASLCADLDMGRDTLLNQLAAIKLPDLPDPWKHEGLNDPLFAEKIDELRAKLPHVDPEALAGIGQFLAEIKAATLGGANALGSAFAASRSWTEFGKPTEPVERTSSTTDDFELADWAYASALAPTSTGHSRSAESKQSEAWKRLMDLANKPAITEPSLPVKSAADVAASPSAWASWVQSMANSGMISAESINASIQGLPQGVVPPPGSPPVESWTQWLDASVKSKPPNSEGQTE